MLHVDRAVALLVRGGAGSRSTHSTAPASTVWWKMPMPAFCIREWERKQNAK